MSLLNIFRALIEYRHDKKVFPESVNRDVIELHIRKDFNHLPEVLSRYYSKKRKFLIFTGATKTKKFGKEVLDVMQDAGYTAELKSVKLKVPSIEKAKEMSSDFNYRIPIGVGGGSVLDFAKLIGKEIGNKSISIPTTLSHDGFASPVASLMKNNKRTSMRVLRPSPIYANKSIIGNVERLNVAGIGEVISNYTAVRDWRNSAYCMGKREVNYSKLLGFFSTVAYGYWFRREIRSEGKITPDVIDFLIGSHYFSGMMMEIAGCSSPCSGAEHLLSHALDELFPNKKSLHGEQVGMFSIPVACLQSKWFRKIGMISRDALRLKKTLETVRAPLSFEELGLNNLSESDMKNIFELAKEKGRKRDRYTVLEHVDFSDFYSAIDKTGIWEEY